MQASTLRKRTFKRLVFTVAALLGALIATFLANVWVASNNTGLLLPSRVILGPKFVGTSRIDKQMTISVSDSGYVEVSRDRGITGFAPGRGSDEFGPIRFAPGGFIVIKR